MSKSRLCIFYKNVNHALFSFEQNKKDSSIYVSSKILDKYVFSTLKENGGNLELSMQQKLQSGKLSFHGSGVSHIKQYADNVSLDRIKGQYLKLSEEKYGVRHLFTTYIAEPNSPIKATRETDTTLKHKTNDVKPFCLIFWAIPAIGQKLTLKYSGTFHINAMDMPPKIGVGGFKLHTHHIFWLSYELKYMKKWPAKTLISYYDGSLVPFFLRTSAIPNNAKEERVDIVFAYPGYALENKENEQIISINLPNVLYIEE